MVKLLIFFDILKFAVEFDGPLAIRYPRGEAFSGLKNFRSSIKYGKSEVLYSGSRVAVLAVGSMVETAESVRAILEASGIYPTVVNVRFVKPMDTEMIRTMASTHELVVTLEENVLRGGFGEGVEALLGQISCNEPDLSVARVLTVGIPNVYVEHGNVDLLKETIGLDSVTIADRIMKELEKL